MLPMCCRVRVGGNAPHAMRGQLQTTLTSGQIDHAVCHLLVLNICGSLVSIRVKRSKSVSIIKIRQY